MYQFPQLNESFINKSFWVVPIIKFMCVLILLQGDIDLCAGDPNDGIDSDCSASSNSGKQVVVGICAMAKKAQSKPMNEILTRLREFDYIHMIVFEEEVILKVSFITSQQL